MGTVMGFIESSLGSSEYECPLKLTYQIPVRIYEEVPEPLQDAHQDSPSKAISYVCRHDMNRSSVAQVIVEGIFRDGKWHIATPLNLKSTISVTTISRFQPLWCATL